MRHGYTEGLAKRLERHNPTARLICEAVVTTAEDIKDTQGEWDAADNLTGMTTLEAGGVKLDGTPSTHVENTTSTTVHTDLNRASPFSVALVRWDLSADIESREITTVTAHLVNRENGGNPGEVTFWRMRLFRVATITARTFTLAPISDFVDVAAGAYSTVAADVTFSFAHQNGGPVIGPRPRKAGGQEDRPYTCVMIFALKGEGVGAGNVGWSADGNNQSITNNNHTVTYEVLSTINDPFKAEAGLTSYSRAAAPGNGVPRFSIKGDSHQTRTVAFTAAGNDIDLGAAPGASTKLRVTAQGQEFSSSTLLYRLDDGGGMTSVVDGDIIGEDNTPIGGTDLSGMTRQQAYDGQVVLTPSAANDVTPIVRRFGVSEIDVQDLDGLVKIGDTSHELDPVSLVGNLPEIELLLLRDGLRDYRDAATELLSDNFIGKLEMRIWVGHPDLARQDWLHLDDFVIDKQDSAGAGIKLRCVSPLAAALTNIPARSGTARAALVYTAQTLKSIYNDILTAQIINYPTRRIGAQIEDATTTAGKTIKGPIKAKAILDEIAYLAGGGGISSQGRYKFVEMFAAATPVAVFPSDTISVTRVDPGYEERVPDIHVGHGFNTTVENNFAAESYASVTNAISNLGRALVDRTEELDQDIAEWCETSTLSVILAKRIVQNFSGGVALISFESIYPNPRLEPGDPVVVETDRLVTKDPHTGTAYRGNLFAIGRVCAVHDTFGTKFTVWMRTYEDVLPTTADTTRSGFVTLERPEVIVKEVRSSTTSTITIDIEDPGLRATAIEFKKRDGSEGGDTLDAAYQTGWTSTTGTPGTNATLQRTIDVPVAAGLEGELQWRLQYTDVGGITRDIGDSFKVVNLEATTGSVMVPYSDVIPLDDATTWTVDTSDSSLRPGSATARNFAGSIELPPSVTATSVVLIGYRDGVSDLVEAVMRKVTDTGASASIIVTITHDTTGWQAKSATISELIAADTIYTFHVQLNANTTATHVRFRGFKVLFNRPAYQYTI